eukprot:6202557-Prymnesium_polylepis.2
MCIRDRDEGERRQALVGDRADARQREVRRPIIALDVLVELVQVVTQQLTHDEQVLLRAPRRTLRRASRRAAPSHAAPQVGAHRRHAAPSCAVGHLGARAAHAWRTPHALCILS